MGSRGRRGVVVMGITRMVVRRLRGGRLVGGFALSRGVGRWGLGDSLTMALVVVWSG